MDDKDKVKWIYSSKDNQELTERYDEWAKDYDSYLEREHSYEGPQLTAGFFSRYVPKTARVLDAGAGTGLMGEVLAKLGYSELVAIDLSDGMLEEAHSKGVYKELKQMILGEALDFAGGYIIFTLSAEAYEKSGFKEKFAILESTNRWKFIEKSQSQEISHGSGVKHRVWVFQVI
jgi:SAM-dependent methyltransferase